jgi:hypothetical protein
MHRTLGHPGRGLPRTARTDSPAPDPTLRWPQRVLRRAIRLAGFQSANVPTSHSCLRSVSGNADPFQVHGAVNAVNLAMLVHIKTRA